MTRYLLTMKFPSRSGEVQTFVRLSDIAAKLLSDLYRDRICDENGQFWLLVNCEWFKLTPQVTDSNDIPRD